MTNRELRIKITMIEAQIAALKLQLESLEQERDVRERFYDYTDPVIIRERKYKQGKDNA